MGLAGACLDVFIRTRSRKDFEYFKHHIFYFLRPLDMLEEATLQVHYDQGSHAPLRHRRYLSNPLREALNHVDWNASFISSIAFNEMGSMVSGNKCI